MNLRQLGYFMQISELESMTRAASVLHVAQPSLSRQMQTLEQELGVLLFVRSDKGVKLTEAGHALRERAHTVLLEVSRIRDEIRLRASEPKGELGFGLPFSVFDHLTMPLLEAYRERYPKVNLRVTEGGSTALHELMLNERLDMAVVSDAEPLNMFRSQLLLREQLYLVGAKKDGFAIENDVSVKALSCYPLILTSRPNALRAIVDRNFSDAGIRASPVIEADSSRLLCGLVERGKGVTVLPFSAISEPYRLGRVSISPLRNMSLTWAMITPRDRGLSLAARKLHEIIKEIVHKQIADGEWLGILALD